MDRPGSTMPFLEEDD
jgi:hypothetical protein